jgi:hypothetical protein
VIPTGMVRRRFKATSLGTFDCPRLRAIFLRQIPTFEPEAAPPLVLDQRKTRMSPFTDRQLMSSTGYH